ncbi:MAG: hypothetical protein ACRDRR_02335 [Pseudonocardiaceae bacterium]
MSATNTISGQRASGPNTAPDAELLLVLIVTVTKPTHVVDRVAHRSFNSVRALLAGLQAGRHRDRRAPL